MRNRMGFLLALLMAGGELSAADWPAFRGGVTQEATSPERDLLQEWPAGGPLLLWTVRVDDGHAQPAVVDGVVYIVGALPHKQPTMRALRLADGSQLWATNLTGYANATPLVANGLVYWNGDRQLVAIEAATGQTVWSVDIAQAGGMPDQWRDLTAYGGVHASLMITQGKIIYTTGFPQAPVIALDAKTGALVWRCQGAEQAQMRGWSSPMVVRRGERDLILAQTLHHLLGIDAVSGKVLWEWDVFGFDKNGKRPANALGNAPVLGGDLLYVASAYSGNAGFGLKLAADGASVTEHYRSRAILPCQESMVRVGNLVFGSGTVSKEDCDANPSLLVNGIPVADYLKQRGPKERYPWENIPQLVCMDIETGKPLGFAIGTEHGQEANIYGSMMLTFADGRLYGVLSGGPQQMLLYEPTPALNVRGRFELPVDSEFAAGQRQKLGWCYSAPMISHGRLLIHRKVDLLCFDIRKTIPPQR